MAPEIFIDTSGFYALLIRSDDQHDRARTIMRGAAKKKLRRPTTSWMKPQRC
jgi:predicted nucleic acid-binding protein